MPSSNPKGATQPGCLTNDHSNVCFTLNAVEKVRIWRMVNFCQMAILSKMICKMYMRLCQKFQDERSLISAVPPYQKSVRASNGLRFFDGHAKPTFSTPFQLNSGRWADRITNGRKRPEAEIRSLDRGWCRTYAVNGSSG